MKLSQYAKQQGISYTTRLDGQRRAKRKAERMVAALEAEDATR
jgi:hypothetical protein